LARHHSCSALETIKDFYQDNGDGGDSGDGGELMEEKDFSFCWL